jgi:hypothetical protein
MAWLKDPNQRRGDRLGWSNRGPHRLLVGGRRLTTSHGEQLEPAVVGIFGIWHDRLWQYVEAPAA